MTQRIFDIYNEKDYADLWDIVPDWVTTIKKTEKDCVFLISENGIKYGPQYIKINWHDKTEITRPVNYKGMIGCVGWFWDNDDEEESLGVLTEFNPETGFPFVKGNNGNTYFNFRPAKKSELKFWGE